MLKLSLRKKIAKILLRTNSELHKFKIFDNPLLAGFLLLLTKE